MTFLLPPGIKGLSQYYPLLQCFPVFYSSLSYRNQSVDLHCNFIDLFVYDRLLQDTGKHCNIWRCVVVVYHYCATLFNKTWTQFCAGSSSARSMLEICEGENLWQWLHLETRLNAFHWLTITQTQFIIIILIVSCWPETG